MSRIIMLASLLFLPYCSALQAQPNTYEKVAHYDAKLENVKWYQQIAIFFLGLDWDTVSIKTTFTKDENGSERIVEVTAWPDNTETETPEEEELVFRLSSATAHTESFLEFVKYTKFRTEEVPKLLALYNYLYDNDMNELKFSTTNLFEKENGSMHCKLNKEKTGGKNKIRIETVNGAGKKNGEVEIIMNPSPEKHLETISAQLKIGIKIILTKMEKPQ